VKKLKKLTIVICLFAIITIGPNVSADENHLPEPRIADEALTVQIP
jgi:hypothetical protein